jgi:hypothetical protein
MWTCSHCSEELEDSFDACWNCGTTADGTKAVHFPPVEKESSPPPLPPKMVYVGPLTHAEVGLLVCRCLALWIFAHGAADLIQLALAAVVLVIDGTFPPAVVGGVLSQFPLAQFGIAAVLWFGAERIGSKLVFRPHAPLHILRANMRSLLPIVFVGTGLFLVIPQIRILVRLAVLLLVDRVEFRETLWLYDTQAAFWSAIANLALGSWFIFDSRRIVRKILEVESSDREEKSATPIVSGNDTASTADR